MRLGNPETGAIVTRLRISSNESTKGTKNGGSFFSLYVRTIDQHEQAVRLAAKLAKGGRRTLPSAIVRWVMGPTGLGSPGGIRNCIDRSGNTCAGDWGDLPVSWR